MKKEEGNRRSFLKHILAGGAVVAGTVAAVGPVKAGKNPVQAFDRQDEVLYHESEDFKKYYKSLRS